MASSRLQRWSLTMSTEDYELIYRADKSNGNADALSRLPLPDRPDSVPNSWRGSLHDVTRAGLRRRQTRQPPRASDYWGPRTGIIEKI